MLNHRHLSLSKGDVTDRALAPAPHIVPTPRIAQQPAQILNVLRRLRRRQIRTLNLLSLVEAALQRDGDRKILPRFCRCARQTGGLTQNRFCIIGLTGHDVRDAKIGEDARIVRLQRQRFWAEHMGTVFRGTTDLQRSYNDQRVNKPAWDALRATPLPASMRPRAGSWAAATAASTTRDSVVLQVP